MKKLILTVCSAASLIACENTLLGAKGLDRKLNWKDSNTLSSSFREAKLETPNNQKELYDLYAAYIQDAEVEYNQGISSEYKEIQNKTIREGLLTFLSNDKKLQTAALKRIEELDNYDVEIINISWKADENSISNCYGTLKFTNTGKSLITSIEAGGTSKILGFKSSIKFSPGAASGYRGEPIPPGGAGELYSECSVKIFPGENPESFSETTDNDIHIVSLTMSEDDGKTSTSVSLRDKDRTTQYLKDLKRLIALAKKDD